VAVRLTDRATGPGLEESATVGDFTFSFSTTCAATPDPASGATCTASTTADASIPDVAVERKRAIWALAGSDEPRGSTDAAITFGCPATTGHSGGPDRRADGRL
jgi:hypothetical protein